MPGDTSKERHFVVQSQVLQRYYAERPKNKREIEAFIHKTATELEIRPKTVERYVVDEEAAVIRQIEAQKVTAAQQIADLIGASQAKAIRKLNTLMDAKKRRIMKDSHGNAVREYDPETKEFTGKVVYETSDDNPTQLAAVREVLKIHGSYAPEEINVTSTSTNLHMHMTEQQLLEMFERPRRHVFGHAQVAFAQPDHWLTA